MCLFGLVARLKWKRLKSFFLVTHSHLTSLTPRLEFLFSLWKSFIENWKICKRNWIFAKNSDFLFLVCKPLILWMLLDQKIKVWNIKGLLHPVAEISGLENLSLWLNKLLLILITNNVEMSGDWMHLEL